MVTIDFSALLLYNLFIRHGVKNMANLINDYYASPNNCVAFYRDGLGENLSLARELALGWCAQMRGKYVQDAKRYYVCGLTKQAKESLNNFHIMQKKLNALRSQTNWEFIKEFNGEVIMNLSATQSGLVEGAGESKNSRMVIDGLSENIAALHGNSLCPNLHIFFLRDGDLARLLKRGDLAMRSVQNYLARQIIKNNGNLYATISELNSGAANITSLENAGANPQESEEK